MTLAGAQRALERASEGDAEVPHFEVLLLKSEPRLHYIPRCLEYTANSASPLSFQVGIQQKYLGPLCLLLGPAA